MNKKPLISVLAVGSELLDGRLCESNSSWIASQLSQHGLDLVTVLTVDDSLVEIVNALEYLSNFSDFVIVSGGLGPTADDITREAIAQFVSKELEFSEQALEDIRAIYTARGREFHEANRKQAMFPAGATVISNPVGTAPGFSVKHSLKENHVTLFSLPGVPHELQTLFSSKVLPCLIVGYESSSASKMLRVFGVPESKLEELMVKLTLPSEVKLSFRATFPEVQLLFKADGGTPQASQDLVHKLSSEASALIGEHKIFSSDPALGMPEVVKEHLSHRGLTVAVAESCSGGLLGKLLSDLPGSSSYFQGGVISYSNHCKVNILGVDSVTLEQHGAVSAPVAEMMARGVRELCQADIGVSITGVAGPDGGSQDKPVGTFFTGFATKNCNTSRDYFFLAGRPRVRMYSCYCVLSEILSYLNRA